MNIVCVIIVKFSLVSLLFSTGLFEDKRKILLGSKVKILEKEDKGSCSNLKTIKEKEKEQRKSMHDCSLVSLKIS